ncbi:FecR family protein [Gaoshiqia sediminis]|uniref:DUF4974 domain-containing protein n=1 Tax=Gaoshiqia sediminis TaxID=2986998 RepID=A0AA41Y8S7_9BACT|nr:FecR domain-containing protein [Gaoshiqia sediminis]MCW0483292.1 DUF4974 domain-containing protein [Gaoshiqia sediminis]
METNNTPWEAIGAYLKDPSDKKSEAIVKAWLKASPDHVKVFTEIINTRRLTGNGVDFYEPQKEELWGELMRRISPASANKTFVNKLWLRYVAVAAAVAIAFFAGNWFSSQPIADTHAPTTYTRVIAPAGHRTQLVLPDSTRVWLNSGSEIKYAGAFSATSREVYIKGECYFEVTENKHKPFVVHAAALNVKVYGTRFNVKENVKENQSIVTLLEGKVEVLNPENESLSFLDPGEQLLVQPDGIQLEKVEMTDALIAWTNGVLMFDDQPFDEVIGYLENWYGVSINLDPTLSAKHHYTFKVKTESLREVLDLISVISPIDYKIEGDMVWIKRKMKS